MLDPAALARIKSLELRARVVVQGFWSGIHRSPYHGFSSEFSEYRQYVSGDDPRFIDWRVFARSDRCYVKRFEDETNLRCQILVDRSASMAYGSGVVTKADYAATLAATFAYFMRRQGDAVGVTTFTEKIEQYLPPKSSPGHLRRLLSAIEKEPDGKGTSVGEPLQQAVEIQRKRGLFVLITDLLAPLDELSPRLAYLRARGHDAIVFQILDPRELDLEIGGPVPLVDAETGREKFVDPRSVRDGYLSALKAHLEGVEGACSLHGIGYCRLSTETPLERALHEFLRERVALGSAVARSQGRGVAS